MIETATPSSAETLAALFDTLVDAVAARVLAQLNNNLDAKLDLLEANIDARVEHAIESFALEQLDGKIDEWASNFLQDRVSEHVTLDGSMLDIHDEVVEIVQEMSFDIRVSR
jgi:hypothetical protein